MRRAGRALVVVASVAALAVGGTAPSTAERPAESAKSKPAVTGYALGSLPSSVVRREAHALASIGVAGVSIRGDGAQVRRPNADLERLLHAAHRSGLSASLLVSN